MRRLGASSLAASLAPRRRSPRAEEQLGAASHTARRGAARRRAVARRELASARGRVVARRELAAGRRVVPRASRGVARRRAVARRELASARGVVARGGGALRCAVTIIHENNGHRRAARSPRAEAQLGNASPARARGAGSETEPFSRRETASFPTSRPSFDARRRTAGKDVPGAVRLFPPAIGAPRERASRDADRHHTAGFSTRAKHGAHGVDPPRNPDAGIAKIRGEIREFGAFYGPGIPSRNTSPPKRPPRRPRAAPRLA
jgi:hypothetical protein